MTLPKDDVPKNDENENVVEQETLNKTTTENDLNKELFKEKKSKKPWIIVGVVALIVAALITTVVLVSGNNNSDQNVGKADKGQVQDGGTGSGTMTMQEMREQQELDQPSSDWWANGNEYPVKLEEWETIPYATLYSDAYTNDERNEVLSKLHTKTYEYNGFYSSIGTLPTRSTGYTDNVDEQTLEDGTFNPLFSYWTAEGFNEFVGSALYRFTNPVFGEWGFTQYSEAKELLNHEGTPYIFNDLYDPNHYDQQISKGSSKDWLPIYADWNSNDYGMGDQFIENDGPRWMGQVKNVSTEFDYDENTGSYVAKVTANVEYSAWSKDQKKLSKNGVITFDVKTGDDPDNRYLISNTKLEIK